MFKRDRWIEIIEALTSNWIRTLLTAFGVFWGIFILVILLAAGNGLEKGVKRGFTGMATNTMFMWSRPTSIPYKGMPTNRRYNFKLDDVAYLKKEMPQLKFVSPRNQLGGFGGANNVVRGLNTGAYNVYGDYPEFFEQQPMEMLKGRFINYLDIEETRKVAVIGLGVQSELYEKGEEILGTYVKISGVNFKVIGLFQKRNSQGDPEEDSKEIYIPFTSFGQAFNRADNVGWMAITAKDGFSITELKEQVYDVIRSRHTIHPDDRRAVGSFDLYEQYNKVNGLFQILNLVAYVVGILILISGVIGISNIMLIVVKERTNEIGVRRALGATPWNIKSQILTESVFLTIISGMVGIILATVVLWLFEQWFAQVDTSTMMFGMPSVDVVVVLIALMILIIAGLFAGFIPAQNAVKVKPVDALRTE